MIEDLLISIESYKSSMEFKNRDFDADKSAQYTYVRKEMSEIYKDIDENLFGPVETPVLPQNFNELTTEEKKEVNKKFKKQNELFNKKLL